MRVDSTINGSDAPKHDHARGGVRGLAPAAALTFATRAPTFINVNAQSANVEPFKPFVNERPTATKQRQTLVKREVLTC